MKIPTMNVSLYPVSLNAFKGTAVQQNKDALARQPASIIPSVTKPSDERNVTTTATATSLKFHSVSKWMTIIRVDE